jgi:RimJ/RimL family protein N-acetyltransferase
MSLNPWLTPIELSGTTVKLSPLLESHGSQLLEAAADGKLWELWYTSVPSESTMSDYINQALEDSKQGTALPFVVINQSNQSIIGSTRFLNAEPAHLRLEIGATWYAKKFQKTGVNTECKYLLLKHAFETLDCMAVEFRTHWHNYPSRNAIQRIGARQDGVLRSHRILANGLIRDTVVYSIIKSEWPSVRQDLEFKISKYRS